MQTMSKIIEFYENGTLPYNEFVEYIRAFNKTHKIQFIINGNGIVKPVNGRAFIQFHKKFEVKL